LEAADEVLVRRYKETRRKHPLADSQDSIIKSITKEREMLANIRGLADTIVDTSNLSNRQLNEEITKIFSQTDDDIMKISIMSFGYKYGLPIEADLVMDVRFLPNPYYVPELRELTGMDESIKKYVFDFQISLDFVYRYADLMQFLLPNYLKEGKKHLTIAIGCTGGRHRSVAISQSLHEILDSYGYHTSIYHRDISKANKKK
ncbi:MAG: RNase adapter RapZ, partial [Clostridiales bacterium]